MVTVFGTTPLSLNVGFGITEVVNVLLAVAIAPLSLVALTDTLYSVPV